MKPPRWKPPSSRPSRSWRNFRLWLRSGRKRLRRKERNLDLLSMLRKALVRMSFGKGSTFSRAVSRCRESGFGRCGSLFCLSAFFRWLLEDLPHKMSQQRKHQEHECADPDQEVACQLWGFDFFLVHCARIL